MPQVKAVRSLRDFSIDCILGKMSLSCSSNFVKKDGAAKNQELTHELEENKVLRQFFQQMPAVLLEEIIMLLTRGSRTLIQDKVLHHLMTPQLQALRLDPFFENDLKFFAEFSKLQVFNPNGFDLKDHCLKVIGTYCKCLRILNIGHCFNVTDAGIEFLCIENQGSGQCKSSLQVLQVKCCHKITKKGIQLALENLTALRYLEHEFTFEVLVELAEMKIIDKKLACVPSFHQLSILRAPYTCALNFVYGERRLYKNRSLSSIISLCPSIVKLELNLDKGFMDTELLCLISLKMLREFIIFRRKGDEIDITFDGGVAPVLKVIGRSLENLNLSCFDVTNLLIVVDFCPNLISLTVCRYFLISNTFTMRSHKSCLRSVYKREYFKQSVLSNLENLKLDCGYNISSDILLFLLSSPTLKKIDIRYCDTLTDDIFFLAFKLHQFQNLNMLHLRSCSLVTYQVIDVLMIDGNPVSSIFTVACQNITKEDVANWKMKFRHRNWKIEWYFCSTGYSSQE